MKKGFTLIELLVVIAILGILAGIAFPSLLKQIGKAKKVTGKKMAAEITLAIEAFENEYDYLPYAKGFRQSAGKNKSSQSSNSPDKDSVYITDNSSSEFLQVLMGKEKEAHINPKEIAFLSIKEAKSGRDGLVYDDDGAPSEVVNPFGNYFYIALDYDSDKNINITKLISSELKKQGKPLIIRDKSSATLSSASDENGWTFKDLISSW